MNSRPKRSECKISTGTRAAIAPSVGISDVRLAEFDTGVSKVIPNPRTYAQVMELAKQRVKREPYRQVKVWLSKWAPV